jgi:hypothetical protein
MKNSNRHKSVDPSLKDGYKSGRKPTAKKLSLSYIW